MAVKAGMKIHVYEGNPQNFNVAYKAIISRRERINIHGSGNIPLQKYEKMKLSCI